MPKDEISIPTILKIEPGVTANIGDFLKIEGITQVTVLFGNGLTEMFGKTVFESFDRAGVKVLHHQEMDTVDFKDITDLAFELPNKTQAVIGMGGGHRCGQVYRIHPADTVHQRSYKLFVRRLLELIRFSYRRRAP